MHVSSTVYWIPQLCLATHADGCSKATSIWHMWLHHVTLMWLFKHWPSVLIFFSYTTTLIISVLNWSIIGFSKPFLTTHSLLCLLAEALYQSTPGLKVLATVPPLTMDRGERLFLWTGALHTVCYAHRGTRYIYVLITLNYVMCDTHTSFVFF